MKLSLKQLEAFVWVADLGSFRRAAERLNTTQPNISARIAALEEMLNVSLMDRDAGSVRLSAKGTELLPVAREVLAATDRFIESAGRSAQVESILRLGVSEMIVNTWLREFIVLARQHFPHVHLELVVDLSINLDRELHSRSLDLAFHSGPFATVTSGAEPLGTYPFVWVASPTLESSLENPDGIHAFAGEVILAHARGSKPYAEIESHFSRAGKEKPMLVPSTNMAACQQMAVDGIGIAALPVAMVRNDIASGQLRRIDYAWTPEPLEFMARFDAATAPAAVSRIALLARDLAQKHLDNYDNTQ